MIRVHYYGAIIALLLVGCTSDTPPQSEQALISAVDSRGVRIELDHIPLRVVSLVPSVTETIYALGTQEKLVGVTTYCNYPPEVASKERVGDFSNPSMERIAGLRPDLVFITTPEQRVLAQPIEDMGIPVFAVQPESIDEILATLRIIGRILGFSDAGHDLFTSTTTQLSEIRRLASTMPDTPRVYLEVSADPLVTVGSSSFIAEMVRAAGGKNLFEADRPYLIVGSEDIVSRDPEVILLLHPTITTPQAMQRLGWEEITAVKNGMVFDDIDPDVILRPGPRVAHGVRELLARIHRKAEATD